LKASFTPPLSCDHLGRPVDHVEAAVLAANDLARPAEGDDQGLTSPALNAAEPEPVHQFHVQAARLSQGVHLAAVIVIEDHPPVAVEAVCSGPRARTVTCRQGSFFFFRVGEHCGHGCR
jgi:hypothetical protein